MGDWKGSEGGVRGQIVGEVILQDVGVEAVTLLKPVVRRVGQHDQDTESKKCIIDK